AYTLDAQNPTSNYLWSTGETTQKIVVTQSGTYYITISNGFCSTKDTINLQLISPEKCKTTIHIPNAFTPNGNSLNEVFKPVIENATVLEYQLNIYNRWGQSIFE